MGARDMTHDNFSRIPSILVAALCLSTCVARAEIERPLVVDMTTLTKTPRREAVQAIISERSPLLPNTYPLISGSSPGFVAEFRWLHPSEGMPTCSAVPRELETQLGKARAQLVELELDAALTTLSQTYGELNCQLTKVTREQLVRLFYLEGIAHHYLGQNQQRARAFLEVVAIHPTAEPLPGFPPDIDEAFRSAKARAFQLKPVMLELDPALTLAGVFLDGEPLPAGTDISLLPGRHLVQVSNEHAVYRSAAFTLRSRESRPFSALFNLMPPGSASYLNALLRASLQGTSIGDEQLVALGRYAHQQHHSMLIFCLLASDGPRLRTFIPGQGLIEGTPEGLEPLPPMEKGVEEVGGDAQVAQQNTQKKKGKKRSRSSGGSRQKSSGPDYDVTSTQAMLGLGTVGYDGTAFTGARLAVALPLFAGVALHTGITFGSDFGALENAARSLTAVNLGPEYHLALGPIVTRVGLGGLLAAGRMAMVDGQTNLILELTPEAWLGVDYPLTDQLGLGLMGGGGFSPGLVGLGQGRALWRGSLVLSWRLSG